LSILASPGALFANPKQIMVFNASHFPLFFEGVLECIKFCSRFFLLVFHKGLLLYLGFLDLGEGEWMKRG